MNGYNLIIEHQCPQCGAPVLLNETDRLITCRYCRVKSYLLQDRYFRYHLPDNAPKGSRLIFVPYWRFKGMLFSCRATGIRHQFFDISHQALATPVFPVSLGLRSQALKLKFATHETPGHFLHPALPFKEVMQIVDNRSNSSSADPVIHKDYIGEIASLIYSPYYIKNDLVDAILNRPVAPRLSKNFNLESFPDERPGGHIRFLPTICPDCGWDLDGEKDSQVLSCRNCQSIWQPTTRKMLRLKFGHIPAPEGQSVLFLPFWRISPDITGVSLHNVADMIRLANLPKIARREDHQKAFRFWAPAFKVRPQNLIRLGSRVTLAQPEEPVIDKLPDQSIHPVNMPVTEAVESLKIILADFMKPRRKLICMLPDIHIRPVSFKLVYIPFVKGPHEYIQPRLQLALNKNMLALSGNL